MLDASGPDVEQVRRELDRRYGRKWPRCKGTVRHRRAARRLRRWTVDELESFLFRRQVRLDPPLWARDCKCGVTR